MGTVQDQKKEEEHGEVGEEATKKLAGSLEKVGGEQGGEGRRRRRKEYGGGGEKGFEMKERSGFYKT